MSAPLAGRPPFATDEPDSFYETSPAPAKRRVAPPKPDDPNKRTSAYDVYDNYIEGENAAPTSSAKNPFSNPSRQNSGDNESDRLRPQRNSQSSRNSAVVGGIGMGLMNMDFSDSDDDSDDDMPRTLAKPTVAGAPASRNAALAAAINQRPSPTSQPQIQTSPFSPPVSETGHGSPIEQPSMPSQSRSPPPIAAPRPGYAAPMAALQNPFDTTSPSPPGNINRMPSTRLPVPRPIDGVPPPVTVPPAALSRGLSLPSMTPSPLQAPLTPIKPVFALPKEPTKEGMIKFDDLPVPTPRKPIMRSQGEETMLPRRGEKGDDFWRRFSMVAKDEMSKKESSWLKKTRGSAGTLSRWVWVVALIILAAIAGAIVLGVLLNRGDSDEMTEPTVLFGATDKMAATFSTEGVPGQTVVSSKTVLHVTPTYTLEARAVIDAITPSPVPTRLRHVRRAAKNF